MAILSGTTDAQRVIAIHKDAHRPVYEAAPVEGVWTLDVEAGEPFMLIYIADGCPPAMHGPYFGEPA